MPRLDPARARTYTSWYEMMKRCSRPSEPQFADYGGRGIQVCERWMDFNLFREDMGDRPEGWTLERKDNNGHYQSDNCCWATRSEQMRNTRRTIRVVVNGVEMCLKDACSSNAHYLAIRRRVRDLGMTFEAALADRGYT